MNTEGITENLLVHDTSYSTDKHRLWRWKLCCFRTFCVQQLAHCVANVWL